MATTSALRVEVNNGSAASVAAAALRRTRGRYDVAMRDMKAAAFASGKSFVQASSGAPHALLGRDTTSVDQAVRAREAFHARVGAEAEKYRAAYLALAMKARAESLAAVHAAVATTGVKREEFVKQASRASENADSMERAAGSIDSIRQNVGEPDAVSLNEVKRRARDAGVVLAASSGTISVPVLNSSMFTQGPENIAAIMPDFFPDEVQAASSALSGIGATESVDWMTAVRQSLGLGASTVGDAALRAGREETKNNTAAGALFAGLGGALQAVGGVLNAQFNAGAGGKAPPSEASSFPVVPVVVVGLGLIGLFIWSRA